MNREISLTPRNLHNLILGATAGGNSFLIKNNCIFLFLDIMVNMSSLYYGFAFSQDEKLNDIN